MSELKVVLYQANRAPRSIALTTRTVYQTMFLAALFSLLIVLSVTAAAKFYLLSRAKNSQISAPQAVTSQEVGPSNSLEEQNRSLIDQLDQMRKKYENQIALQKAPREIDKKNPALALFGPLVVDKTQNQAQVVINNFKYSKGSAKTPATLTFELHNAREGETTEKGYIVVLARRDTGLYAYPNVFNTTGPYLLDFEKGETFQVARFRMVNAQFDVPSDNFQIFIFTRSGELLINTTYEVKNGAE